MSKLFNNQRTNLKRNKNSLKKKDTLKITMYGYSD